MTWFMFGKYTSYILSAYGGFVFFLVVGLWRVVTFRKTIRTRLASFLKDSESCD